MKEPTTCHIAVNGNNYEVKVIQRERSRVVFSIADRHYEVEFLNTVASTGEGVRDKTQSVSDSRAKTSKQQSLALPTSSQVLDPNLSPIYSPMPGVVIAILAPEGTLVKRGDVLLKLEAMKMENNVISPTSGCVEKLYVSERAEVSDSQILLSIRNSPEAE
ncbi:MAG: hypothetical protein IT291_09440 [Deltaproteobacteria bacterium]|nr:hypothetical protein [Deltaproteobacteria bacterium]